MITSNPFTVGDRVGVPGVPEAIAVVVNIQSRLHCQVRWEATGYVTVRQVHELEPR